MAATMGLLSKEQVNALQWERSGAELQPEPAAAAPSEVDSVGAWEQLN